MVHLIKKQIIEIKLERSLNYYTIQQKLSDQYWNEIIPVLERSFNKVSNEDEIFEIDQLELDLGIVNSEKLNDNEWVEEIKKKIEEQIAIITNPASPHYSIRPIKRRIGAFWQWLYYMDHGFLPWNNKGVNELWYQDIIEAIAVDITCHKIVKERIQLDSEFLKRLIGQHADGFLNTLIEIITARKQQYLPDFLDELKQLNKHLAAINSGFENDLELRNRLWKYLLKWAVSDKPGDVSELHNLLVKTYIYEKQLTEDISDFTAAKLPITGSLIRKYSLELKEHFYQKRHEVESFINQMAKHDKIGSTIADEAERIKASLEKASILEEGIYIMNAGVILLHPFLKSFFSRLELIKDGSFIDKGAQLLAMHLIHFLATGSMQPKEYELVLAKILCGYPFEETIDIVELIDLRMKEESESLLKAVIDQWEILKNTSQEGLREGFLQRPGKLITRNGNMYLQVEKNSIDILLDYLPWSISIIMLPWMKDILRVEWR